MAKFNRTLLTILGLTGLLLAGGWNINLRVSLAETAWDEVFSNFFNNNNEPPTQGGGGSRGEPPCLITPVEKETDSEIWSDRPIFIWRGEVKRIELRSHESGELLWIQKILESTTTQSIPYTGDPLKLGQTYDLMLFDSPSEEVIIPQDMVTFTVIEGVQRNQITQDLAKIDNRLQQQTKEEIALARAQYFAENQLWSDAIVESFSVKDPSSDLAILLKDKFPEKLCGIPVEGEGS